MLIMSISDKELLKQMLQREIVNLVETAAPQFKMFSGVAANFVYEYIEPYVDAFLSPDDGSLNKKAARSIFKTRD
jgi:hypothetical protein